MTRFPTADFFGGRGFIGTNSVKLSWINLKSTGTYMKHMKQRLASAHINDNDDPLIFHAWLEENSWCYKGRGKTIWHENQDPRSKTAASLGHWDSIVCTFQSLHFEVEK